MPQSARDKPLTITPAKFNARVHGFMPESLKTQRVTCARKRHTPATKRAEGTQTIQIFQPSPILTTNAARWY
jgi:hypothetical protein